MVSIELQETKILIGMIMLLIGFIVYMKMNYKFEKKGTQQRIQQRPLLIKDNEMSEEKKIQQEITNSIDTKYPEEELDNLSFLDKDYEKRKSEMLDIE